MTRKYVEEIADERVLPVMKDYPDDKFTYSEILHLAKLQVNDNTMIEALNYLEAGGEVISFGADEVKPKMWAVTLAF